MQGFGRWGPDAATLNAGLAGEASGVYPGQTGYRPWPQLAIASTALPTACRGAYTARTTSNSAAVFAGTATKLFKFAAGAWTDVSKAAGYGIVGDDLWQFAQFGPNLYATQMANPLQTIDVTVGSAFADAPGNPPQARYISVIGDFLMLGNTSTNSREVRWCARNNPASWTKYTQDADAQTFPDGGDVMGLAGFEQGGLVFQTEVIRHMTTRQDAMIMEFHRIETSQGTLAPYSIVNRQGVSYYYAVNGFYRISTNATSEPIGANWVDQWFIANSNASTRPKAIIGSYDPASPRIFWLFASSQNATLPVCDHALCFDPSLVQSDYGPWSHAPLTAAMIFPSATLGATLEGLGAGGLGYVMDPGFASPVVPYSLDADVWKGGAPRLAAFDGSFRMGFFTGNPMQAILQTGLFQPVPGSRAFVNGFRFVGDAATATGRIAVTERQQTPEIFGGAGSLTPQGLIYGRASGRHMRIEVDIPANTIWTKASGINFDDDAGLVAADGQR